MSRETGRKGPNCGRFPRVSGDEPGEFKFRDEFELFSPRERG